MALAPLCRRTFGHTPDSRPAGPVAPHARGGAWALSGALVAALVALGSPAARADVATFVAAKDNTLYEVNPDTLSNGKGSCIFVGLPGTLRPNRALVAFDIGFAVRPGSTVNSVKLRLHMSRTINGPQAVTLHRVLADWGEGTSNADNPPFGGGGGTKATAGDATWGHRFFPGTAWAALGGDFTASPSASVNVDQVAFYEWGSTPEMVADVQAWVDAPDSNFGWLVHGVEGAQTSTSKRFESREATDPNLQPMLVIDFTRSPTDVAAPAVRAVRLEPAYPNPFNPTTTLAYALREPGRARLDLHDARGAWIATLVDGLRPAGRQTATWDGRDAAGRRVASGVYVVRLESGGWVDTQRVVITK